MSKQVIYPALRYADAPAAMAWLGAVLGFTEHEVHPGDGGTIEHAQLDFGGNMIMLSSARGDLSDAAMAPGGVWVYLVTRAVDDLYRRAIDAGAEVVHEIADQDYGSREFTVRDPEGNLWTVGTYEPEAE